MRYDVNDVARDIECPACGGVFTDADVVGAKYERYLRRVQERARQDDDGKWFRERVAYVRSNVYFIRCPHCGRNIRARATLKAEIYE